MIEVIYKPIIGKEKKEYFDMIFWAEEFVRELKKQSLIEYVYLNELRKKDTEK